MSQLGLSPRRARGRRGLLAGLLLVGVLASACPKEDSTHPRGESSAPQLSFPQAPVILISVDTLRSDHLPAYGYGGVKTPAFDSFRQDAILFERAYSHYPLTLPSHVSIFTGMLPSATGMRDNIGYKLDANTVPYLPLLMQQQGYATGAAVSAVVLESPSGLSAGFDFYSDEVETTGIIGLSAAQRRGDETAKVALDWLSKVGERPPFLFFHIYEPHSPHDQPEPYASLYADPYDGDIAFADAVLGRFLDGLRELGYYDKSIIFLFSDHGEGLGEHGEAEHGVLLYRESLQVPLMLKLPGNQLAGRSTAALAQLTDLAPTALALLDQPIPPEMNGSSLLSLLAPDPPQRQIYSETYYPRLHLGWNELTSLIEGDHHLIQGPDPELYDLATDTGETHNLLLQQRRLYAHLKESLKPFLSELKGPEIISQEAADKLAALGYLSTGTSSKSGPLPDPKAHVHILEDLQKSTVLLAQKRYEEAVESSRQVLENSPEMPQAWINLGLGLLHLDRLEESLGAYREALKIGGPQPRLVVRTASLFEALGQPEEAVKLLQATVEYGTDHPSVVRQLGLSQIANGQPQLALATLEPLAKSGKAQDLNALGVALYANGKMGQAQALFERVLQEKPDNAKALESLGGVMLATRRGPEALRLLERAVEVNDQLPIAWNSLGVARQWAGDTAGAIAAWQRSIQLDPRNLDVLFNLGLTAAEHGRRNIAIDSLRRYLALAPAKGGNEVAQARRLLAQLERG